MNTLNANELNTVSAGFNQNASAAILDGALAGGLMGLLAYSGFPNLRLFACVFNGVVLGVAINALKNTHFN